MSEGKLSLQSGNTNMSRVGKQELQIPQGVTIILKEGAIVVAGPKGELTKPMRSEIAVSVENNVVTAKPTVDTLFARAMWGTTMAHIANLIEGVTKGFEKKLEVQGVGYKAELVGNTIKCALGFSHPVIFDIPKGLTVTIEKNVITISGADKDALGQFAANIRATKKPEPYKGKGIRYSGEYVRMKEGKKNV